MYSICCSSEEDIPELPGAILTEAEQEKLYLDVYNGEVTPEKLPVELYYAIANTLDDGIRKGVDIYESYGLTYKVDSEFYSALQNNAFIFSGAKTFAQIKEMSDLLVDEPTFKEFKEKAKKVFEQHNGLQVGSYLRTEYEQAYNGSLMASKWQDYTTTSDLFPLLKYDTVGDLRVREEHKALNGIVKPVNDPFWDTYYPPNGWRCRCDVEQLEEKEAVITDVEGLKLPIIKPEFAINFGKNKILYSPEHPYFIVEEQYKKLKDNNFNLPLIKNLSK